MSLKIVFLTHWFMWMAGMGVGMGIMWLRTTKEVSQYDSLAGCELAARSIHHALFKVERHLSYCETDRDTAREQIITLKAQGCKLHEQKDQE